MQRSPAKQRISDIKFELSLVSKLASRPTFWAPRRQNETGMRGPFRVLMVQCERPGEGASEEVVKLWGEIEGHWNKKSRCLIALRAEGEEGWRLWARPDYESAFWRAVDLLEGNQTMATFSGSWLIKDATGLMSIGEMTWSSDHNPPATTESEMRALYQFQLLGDGAPAFMKQWVEDRKKKPAKRMHSPRQLH